MWKEKYNLWKNANLPEILKTELNTLSEKELQDAFHQDLEFGTGGLRGIMGVGTNRMNEIVIKKITLGLGNYLLNNDLKNGVAIAHDNRINSKEFAFTAAKVLANLGIKVFIFPELRPTPMLSFAIRHFKTSGGIMITASHNPKEYNGFKAYNQDGGQLNLEESAKVIDEINKVTDIFNIAESNNELINWIDTNTFDQTYINNVRSISLNNPVSKAITVFSPLHGTGGTITPKLFNAVNYPIFCYEPHMIFDGHFPNTKSSNPEEAIAYEEIIKYAKTVNADIVALTDPDADRLGIAAKHHEDFVVLTGNQTAIILLHYIITQKVAHKISIENGYVFTTNVTSDLIIKIAERFNLNVVVTLSGFKFIAEAINKIPENGHYIFGCEESNGSIINPFVRDKDAIQSVYMFSELASFLKDKNMSVIDYLNAIYDEFGHYYERTVSYTFKGFDGKEKMAALMDHFRTNSLTIKNTKVVELEDNLTQLLTNFETNKQTKINLPVSNILKFYYDDGSWIVIRPSGTEPKIKFYISCIASSIEEATKEVNQRIAYIESLI